MVSAWREGERQREGGGHIPYLSSDGHTDGLQHVCMNGSGRGKKRCEIGVLMGKYVCNGLGRGVKYMKSEWGPILN